MAILKRMLPLLIGLTLSACAQATNIPTPQPTPTPTITTALTETASPLPLPSQTPSLLQTLEAKPYIIVNRPDDERKDHLWLYDTNGGSKEIRLPSDGQANYDLNQAVSPNGEWLAFYTGDFELYKSRSETIPAQLPITLNLLNLSDGTIRKVADVVTDGYREKLNQVAEQLKTREPNYYKPNEDGDWVSGSILSAFKSIYNVAWSPDGSTLAFAAQIDGLSSDVYLYDLKTSSVQQVEESLQNAWYMHWSPDGKYIVVENSHPGNIYTGSSLHVVKLSKQVIKEPKLLYSNPWLSVGDWLFPNVLLIFDGSDTAGNFNLRKLNIETGEITDLWLGAVSTYAVDDQNKTILINTGEFADADKRGVYLLTASGTPTKILDGIYYLSLFFRAGGKYRFIVTGIGGKKGNDLHGANGLDLKPNHQTFFGDFDYQHISISPDHTWMLLFDDAHLYLYDKHDLLAKTFAVDKLDKIIWQPDSHGIFYTANMQLYFLSIPDGKPKLIQPCEQQYCRFNLQYAAWLP